MFLNCVTTVLLIELPLLLQFFCFFVFLIYHSSYLKEILAGISGQNYHDTPWEVERIAEEHKTFYFTKPMLCTLRGRMSFSLLPRYGTSAPEPRSKKH